MSGLVLPKVGPADAVLDRVEERWSTMATARLRSSLRGLHQLSPPEHPIPEVTVEHLTDPKQTAVAVALLLPWQRYLGRVLAELRGEMLEKSNEKQDIAVLMRRQERELAKDSAVRMSAQQIDDAIWENPRHKELVIAEQQLTQQKDVVQQEYESVERKLKTLTRTPDSKPDPHGPQQFRRPAVPETPEPTPVPAQATGRQRKSKPPVQEATRGPFDRPYRPAK